VENDGELNPMFPIPCRNKLSMTFPITSALSFNFFLCVSLDPKLPLLFSYMALVVMTRRSGSRRPLPYPHCVATPRQSREAAVDGRHKYGEQILDEQRKSSTPTSSQVVCSDLIFVSNFDIFSKPSVCHYYRFTAAMETEVKKG
jgi:hypothetical protein